MSKSYGGRTSGERRLVAAPFWKKANTLWHGVESLLRRRWEAVGLVMSGLLAFALTTWQLTYNGYGNLYYAAAAKSMASNAHAFFFASLDPSGYVSVDKPPVGLWTQVAFISLMGFSPLALLLPQALAGALAPPLLGLLVRRSFTPSAGLIAAFALALTPIWIVAARGNIVDVPLALTLLLAAGALLRALEGSSAKWQWEAGWVVLAFAFVGIAFNIKMMEAYLAVPALVLTYFLFSKRPQSQRLGILLGSLLVMLALSLAWIAVVDATPASQRPYVGSTFTNSELDLAVGYNGFGRLFGHMPLPGAPFQLYSVGPNAYIGEPGPLRFLQPELGSQISWLLPIALLGLIASWPFVIPRADRKHAPTGREALPQRAGHPGLSSESMRQAGYVLWASWLVTGLVFFSTGRKIDAYYLVVIAPPLCAVLGFGAVALWKRYIQGAWDAWLLPLAILSAFLEQAYLVLSRSHWNIWEAVLVVGAVATSILVLVLVQTHRAQRKRRAASASAGFAKTRLLTKAMSLPWLGPIVMLCLIVPGLWTLSSLTPGNAGSHPIAGPLYARAGQYQLLPVDPALLSFLHQQRRGAYYLVGAHDSGESAPLILATSDPIMTIGGFNGNDPTLTIPQLYRLIERNAVRLFLLPAGDVTLKEREDLFAVMFPGRTGILPGPTYTFGGFLYHWIATHCSPVPPLEWSSDHSARYRLGQDELFDCSTMVARKVALPA